MQSLLITETELKAVYAKTRRSPTCVGNTRHCGVAKAPLQAQLRFPRGDTMKTDRILPGLSGV